MEEATQAYHEALLRFNLPPFAEAGGMRWVTPVLLHGAVPLDHLDELLDLLAIRRRRDPSLTGESFVESARIARRELAVRPRALTRFLEFGGDFAPDFVSRVIDFVDGEEVVLPRRSIERLREVLATGRGRTATPREARPSLAMIVDGSIVLRLPPVRPSRGREVLWTVQLGDAPVQRREEIPWDERHHKTRGATIEVPRPVREITVMRDGFCGGHPLRSQGGAAACFRR